MPACKLNKIGDYRSIVCDMDGTLYFQAPVRAAMMLELLAYHAVHPWRAGDLLILRSFRRLRESAELVESRDFDRGQYLLTAQKCKTTPGHVRAVVEQWMQKKPLKWLRLFRDGTLIERLNGLRRQGVKIIVFSDYPAEEKTVEIGLCADGVFSASDRDIGELKPSVRGLAVIAEKMSLKKSEMLMIGDRHEKDGKCAENFSIDCLILKRGVIARAFQPVDHFYRNHQHQREDQG